MVGRGTSKTVPWPSSLSTVTSPPWFSVTCRTIDSPKPSTNRVSCELVLPDGTAVTVGSWGYDDVAGGAWAVLSGGELEPGLYETDGTVVAESPGVRLHGFQFTPVPPRAPSERSRSPDPMPHASG